VVAYVIPKLGPHPEIRSFKCPACDEVEAHGIEGAEEVIAYQGPERRKAAAPDNRATAIMLSTSSGW
jgi:hypothetical protein